MAFNAPTDIQKKAKIETVQQDEKTARQTEREREREGERNEVT